MWRIFPLPSLLQIPFVAELSVASVISIWIPMSAKKDCIQIARAPPFVRAKYPASPEDMASQVGRQSVQLSLVFLAWCRHSPHEETGCLLKVRPITREVQSSRC
eukprot:3875845-Amphidinium_carterae.3